MFKKSLLTLAFTGVATLSTYATAADTLTMEVYNPGEKSVFPVSSGNHQRQTRSGADRRSVPA